MSSPVSRLLAITKRYSYSLTADLIISPIAREGTINCVDGSTVLVFDDGFVAPSVLPEESYSKDSKCFERVDGDSLCLTAFCSREPRVMTVQAGSEMFTCSSDFQLISFTSSTGTPVQFTCPRLSAACPEYVLIYDCSIGVKELGSNPHFWLLFQFRLFCPANCSGKGVCNFEAPTPYCECFDPNDSTDGCYESLPKSPEICERETPTTSNNVNHRPLLDIPSWMIAITMGLFGIL